MNKTIYLSGAMGLHYESGEKEKAERWREEAERYFNTYGDSFTCSNPCTYFGLDQSDGKNDHEIMRFDLRKVREADIILVNLEDIRYSIGTSDEVLYGFISQKPIVGFIRTDRELTRKEIMDYVHTWKFEQIDRIETGVNAQQKAMDYIMYRYGV